ncbi:hypothetical protein [Micromonospora pallida]|uniref:DUF7873 family protein n=1 Tax=Micromonospora pallida TaxID=145854 RepID=UPI000A91B4ED|nr:hypothetical protein [Micromonospora pallida]
MAKLNQIIAVTKGVKAQTTREFVDAQRNIQKAPMLSGISAATSRRTRRVSSFRRSPPGSRCRPPT